MCPPPLQFTARAPNLTEQILISCYSVIKSKDSADNVYSRFCCDVCCHNIAFLLFNVCDGTLSKQFILCDIGEAVNIVVRTLLTYLATVLGCTTVVFVFIVTGMLPFKYLAESLSKKYFVYLIRKQTPNVYF